MFDWKIEVVAETTYPQVVVTRVDFLDNEFQLEQAVTGTVAEALKTGEVEVDVISISKEQAIELAHKILKLAGEE